LSTIDWDDGKKEDVRPNKTFFYKTSDEALSELKKAYENAGFKDVVQPYDFYPGCGCVVEEANKKVGLIRRKRKWVAYKHPNIYHENITIAPYEDGEIKGFMLNIKILGGFNDLIFKNLRIAEALEKIREKKLKVN
jgi:hypothetical protein